MQHLSRRLAAFSARLENGDVPADVLEAARACLLNGLGIGLASHGTPYAAVVRHTIVTEAAAGGATLLFDGRRVEPAAAALANAVLLHGRAQEDTLGGAHIGAVVIPALLACAEAYELPLDGLMVALVVGYEVGGALEQYWAPLTNRRGLRGTALYGTIAAAAASAHLLRLDLDRTAAAISIASAFAGGTYQSFADGADEWRYQVGVAARDGLLAAQLARGGAVASPGAFEGQFGFARAYPAVECDTEQVAGALGTRWLTREVRFKPHPVCAFNQSVVEAALRLRVALGGRRLAQVHVSMNPAILGIPGMLGNAPFKTLTQTLMSVRFCAATALCRGAPTIAALQAFEDPAVLALVEKIIVQPDSSFDSLGCRLVAVDAEGASECAEVRPRAEDFSWDRSAVGAHIKRVAGEMGIRPEACEQLENWVQSLPHTSLADLLPIFTASSLAGA